MTTPTTEKAPATISEMNKQIRDLHEKMLADNTTPDQLLAFQKEQATLITAIRTKKENRVKEVDAVKAKLTALEISIQEAFGDKAIYSFTDEEILKDAKRRRLSVVVGENDPVATDETAKPPKKPRAPNVPAVYVSDKNPAFIVIPRKDDDHQRVGDVVIKQGRANETIKNSKAMFGPLPKNLDALVGKTKEQTIANLKPFADKAFLATEQGKKEMNDIAEFVTKAKNTAATKAKEKAEATPHKEAQADMQATA